MCQMRRIYLVHVASKLLIVLQKILLLLLRASEGSLEAVKILLCDLSELVLVELVQIIEVICIKILCAFHAASLIIDFPPACRKMFLKHLTQALCPGNS